MIPRPLTTCVYRRVGDPDAEPHRRHVEVVGWYPLPPSIRGWLLLVMWDLRDDASSPAPDPPTIVSGGLVGRLLLLLLALPAILGPDDFSLLICLAVVVAPTVPPPPAEAMRPRCAGGDAGTFVPLC